MSSSESDSNTESYIWTDGSDFSFLEEEFEESEESEVEELSSPPWITVYPPYQLKKKTVFL